MYFKSGITSWVDPNTKEFIDRREYDRLSKRGAAKGLSAPEYLTSLGYIQDKYHYYRLRDKMFLENAEIIQELKVVTVWLNNLRDKEDLEQAVSKIQGIIKILENK